MIICLGGTYNEALVRRGFIKMHIAVDIKTKKIVALEITKEDVHDNKKFKDLIE